MTAYNLDDIPESISDIELISLFKHGVEVFGTQENFCNWLIANNFYLDNDTPMNYLKTISGIRLIEDRLTGIEYGDNV